MSATLFHALDKVFWPLYRQDTKQCKEFLHLTEQSPGSGEGECH